MDVTLVFGRVCKRLEPAAAMEGVGAGVDVVMVVVLGVLFGLVDAMVRDGAAGHEAVRVAVQLARHLQVRPLVAVAQVLLAQVPQRVPFLDVFAEQLVREVQHVVRHTPSSCVMVMMKLIMVQYNSIMNVIRVRGVRLSHANVERGGAVLWLAFTCTHS